VAPSASATPVGGPAHLSLGLFKGGGKVGLAGCVGVERLDSARPRTTLPAAMAATLPVRWPAAWDGAGGDQGVHAVGELAQLELGLACWRWIRSESRQG